MLYVKTKVLPSEIHGLGLFADQFIPKGTLIWKFTEGFDRKFTEEEILAFPETLQNYLATYAWLSKKSNLYIHAVDAGNYFNHCDEPNVRSEYREDEPEEVTYALRDIQPGEELTDDYSNFEDPENNNNILFSRTGKYEFVHQMQDRRVKVE